MKSNHRLIGLIVGVVGLLALGFFREEHVTQRSAFEHGYELHWEMRGYDRTEKTWQKVKAPVPATVLHFDNGKFWATNSTQ